MWYRVMVRYWYSNIAHKLRCTFKPKNIELEAGEIRESFGDFESVTSRVNEFQSNIPLMGTSRHPNSAKVNSQTENPRTLHLEIPEPVGFLLAHPHCESESTKGNENVIRVVSDIRNRSATKRTPNGDVFYIY